jgi:hypothetical protein
VWEGDVEVFELVGDAGVKRAYAWSEATAGTKRRFFAVLPRHPAPTRASVVPTVSRSTPVMRAVERSEQPSALLDETMVDLPCTRLELDELWEFRRQEAAPREGERRR